jgi:uncharacterized protein YecE (DUF72 family)
LVGCAGWSISKDAASSFPDTGSQLERYASVFPVVEINSSFYRPHRPQTYERWAASVPAHFRFSVKLAKAITHEARLCGVSELISRFAGEVTCLGDKLGCVLVQLAPKHVFDAGVGAEFFRQLQDALPCMVALEARHPSWFGDEATALLRERGITRVIADPPAGQPGPHVPTAGPVYLRLHGSPRVYYSPYTEDLLDRLTTRIATEITAGNDVWCIFDNTLSGSHIEQASYLLDRLRGD